MTIPALTDPDALAAARRMRLRHPEAVLQPGLLRTAIELCIYGRTQARDAAWRRMQSRVDLKRVAAGDADAA